MNEFLKILLIIALSSVKFMAGPPFYYFNKQYSFTFFETIGLSVLGGMVGVVVFAFFSDLLFKFWHFISQSFKKAFAKKEVFSTPKADIEGDYEINYSFVPSVNTKKSSIQEIEG